MDLLGLKTSARQVRSLFAKAPWNAETKLLPRQAIAEPSQNALLGLGRTAEKQEPLRFMGQ
jgi:hypothetical protein